MRAILPIILVTLAAAAQADAYKCKDLTGKVTFTASPCPDDSRQISTAPASKTSQGNDNQAWSDLERQKAWLNNRQAEKNREAQNTPQPIPQYVHNAEKLNACLMAVTATPRLSGAAAAIRRVNCFRGTQGLTGECQASVAATPGLTIHEEANLQSQCLHL